MKRRDFLKSLSGLIGGLIGVTLVKPEIPKVDVPVEPEKPREEIHRPRFEFPDGGAGSCFTVTGWNFYGGYPDGDGGEKR